MKKLYDVIEIDDKNRDFVVTDQEWIDDSVFDEDDSDTQDDDGRYSDEPDDEISTMGWYDEVICL